MARGKARSNIIEVKESEKRYTTCYGVGNLQEILKESRKKACELEMAEKLAKMSQKELKLDVSSLTTADKEVDQCSATKQATPDQDELQKKDEFTCNEVGHTESSAEIAANTLEPNLMIAEQAFIQDELQKKSEFIDVQLAQLEGSADGNANDKGLLEPNLVIAEQADGNGEKKKKRKKKKKDKNNKKKSNADTDESEADKDMMNTEVKRTVRLAPIKKTGSTKEQEFKEKEPREADNAGCFGFINSWLVKRREKRRAKKRKAIEARQSKTRNNLVVYGNKRARGGVAFTVELDSRPIDRSVLPPIAKRPGPIRMATEQKLENAETKREQQLDKKREAARAQSRLVREAADRRAQNEEEYKQKTHEKVYRKHNKAAESKQINKKIETARAHSRLVRETAEKRAKCEAEFKQATLYKILLKDQKTSNLLQRAREEQRSRCASRCATRCASRMDSARGSNANTNAIHDTFLDN